MDWENQLSRSLGIWAKTLISVIFSIKLQFYLRSRFFHNWIGALYMGYPSIPFTVTLTDDFNLFFEKTVDFYYNI